MEFPKKITRNYVKFGGVANPPDILIRGCGEWPSIKIAEYTIKKRIGTLVFYKRR